MNDDMRHYYSIFPQTGDLEKQYKTLTRSVYEKLVQKNTKMLAVVSCKHSNSLTTSKDTQEV